ncbi:MAG: phage holin family protein [Lachnospiraceae bacterium]|nr:phage holin family protein [Lachnospiraceae bacterium]
MNERKMKTGFSARMIVGIVFSMMGAIFFGAGVFLLFMAPADIKLLFFLIFGGLGLVFLVIGVICLYLEGKKRSAQRKLFENGNYIEADFFDIDWDTTINVNGRHPYFARFRYQDPYGDVHIFKSRNMFINPDTLMTDRKVKVYVNGTDYKYYYVDIDEILPNVYEH